MSVDSIPVAHTPPGGWSGTFPDPVLTGCTDPTVDGAPDMRGMWQSSKYWSTANRLLGMR